MLVGENLIYFGPEKWEGLWRNRHQLMSRFAKHNLVLYVEPKTYLKKARHQWRSGSLRWQDFWQDLKQNRVKHVKDNLYIYHSPIFLPISGRHPLDKITWFLWKSFLKLTIQRLGLDKPIVWLSRPDMVNLTTGLNAQLTIYHVVDEYLSYTSNNVETQRWLETREQEMLRSVDIVIVVSENLFQAKKPFNQQTYIVPNAVNYQAYSKVLDNSIRLPSDIRLLPKPVIGYSGLVAARLDLALLQYIAKTYPEWSITLVGLVDNRKCATELNELRKMPNVHFLGMKQIDQVPNYVRAFDVCLIPYKVDERAQNSSPLKLYDYMAAGKPTVATDFAAAQLFKNLIYIAQSHQGFAHCIEKALAEDDRDLVLERQRIVAENSWEKRVEQISSIIKPYLKKNDRQGVL